MSRKNRPEDAFREHIQQTAHDLNELFNGVTQVTRCEDYPILLAVMEKTAASMRQAVGKEGAEMADAIKQMFEVIAIKRTIKDSEEVEGDG